ncbi:Ig-like domain-containing protein, partial [Zobellia laminariae]|uniref:Ig-like domain-containing protein n=1 Tax=Zobellia laminariae TaxID=248906 RepID=UPI003EF99402
SNVSGSAALEVTISEILVTSITVSSGRASIPDDATEQFNANVLPANADNRAVTWNSSNAAVATVNATTGMVSAVSAGNTSIVATATDGSGVSGSAPLEITALPAYVFSNGRLVGDGTDYITGILTINSPTAFEIFAMSASQITVVTLTLNPGGPYSATANHGSVDSVSTPVIPVGTYTYTISLLTTDGQGGVEGP